MLEGRIGRISPAGSLEGAVKHFVRGDGLVFDGDL